MKELSYGEHLNNSNVPWILSGDFNTARFTNEKVRGRNLNSHQLSSFNDFITSCYLMDLRSVGSIWSWNNKNVDGTIIAGRLDRLLRNAQWIDTLPISYFEYLPHSCSEHSPMHIHLLKNNSKAYIPIVVY